MVKGPWLRDTCSLYCLHRMQFISCVPGIYEYFDCDSSALNRVGAFEYGSAHVIKNQKALLCVKKAVVGAEPIGFAWLLDGLGFGAFGHVARSKVLCSTPCSEQDVF